MARLAVFATISAAIIGGSWVFTSPTHASNETFRFRLFEGHQTYEEGIEPYFLFQIETIEEKPCYNWRIDTRWSLSGGRLSVTLGDIIKPEGCFDAFGQAKSEFQPDLREGSYSLTIVSGGRTDTYQVTINSAKIEITPVGGAFTEPEFTRFYRPPPNSFAYYCGTVYTDEYFCDLFRQEIERIGAQPIEFASDGKSPFPGASNGYYYNMQPRFYRYSGAEEWQRITDAHKTFVLRTLRDRCGAGVWLQNWRNEQFHSWLLVTPECDGSSAPTPTPAPALLPRTGADPVQREHPLALIAAMAAAILAAAGALVVSAARRLSKS